MLTPFARLTDDQIRSADLLRLVDPTNPGYHIWLPVRLPDPAERLPLLRTPVERVVAIDRDRATEQARELRRRIAGLNGSRC
ncbi:MAG TPA: hypothetical protein VKE74_00400 [Gemmataceae bacterium]|nr:hypothetical protein [Gemmataceae bacterium]